MFGKKSEFEVESDWKSRSIDFMRDEAVDVTLPSSRGLPGARHPVTTFADRLTDTFMSMGYEVAEGPEIEAEWLNFDALNMGPEHPARSMHDTFYLDESESVVLRTHTSGVQIRSMLAADTPPVYVVCPGRVFRTDELDATHSPVFHQIELLAVDEGLTLAHLKGTLNHLVASLFGEGLETRLRPSYFPFTEPSAEMDMVCFVCRGASAEDAENPCRTCSSEGWIELGGCGMVNPRVLRAVGIDPEKYSGFAFGFGIERMLMFRHSIKDLRAIFEGDVRFIRPFGTEI